MSWIDQTVQTWQAGSVLRIQRDPVTISGALVNQPWRKIGLCQPVSLNAQPTENEIIDSSSGSLQLVGKHRTRNGEAYDVQSQDLNINNLALLFGNVVPQAFTQAAATLTDIAHVAFPGAEIALVDGSGVRQYMVKTTGLTAKTTAGSTPLVLGTDFIYTQPGLDEGFITILPTSTVITAETPVQITFQTNAIAGNRLIVPDFSGCGVINCNAEIVWARCDGGERTVRSFRALLSVTNSNVQVENPSTITVRVEKIYDPTNAYPNGKFLYFKGKLNG